MTDKAYEAEMADFASLMVDETIATIRVQLVAGEGLTVPDQIAVVDQLIKERKRLAATPTPPTPSEDLREAIEGVIEHVEVRIQDGKEIGSTVWRLALEDVARDLRAALVKQRAAPKPAPVTIPPARSYADEDVARMIDPWAWDEAERYRVRADHWFAKGRTEPGDCLTDGYRARADAMQAPLLAKAAAIRLLSQGEKA